jgi:hypothetical protein
LTIIISMRQRCCVLFLLLALASKNGPAAQVEQHVDNSKPHTRELSSLPWVPEEYPNPDLDQRACRTVLNRFCDPDAILKEPEKRICDVIDDWNNRIAVNEMNRKSRMFKLEWLL